MAMLRESVTSFYHQNDLGSVTSLSNAAGAITYTYDSYGNLAASSGSTTNPFRYTGREFDSETGLYFYRARYYDPAVGRFISEDPIGFDAGANFYGYVENNPINSVDPSGLRDVIIVIWNQKGSSVGHAGVFELNGTPILSQFPKDCHCPTGKNVTLDWTHTREQEGRDPDRIFQVHIPDDAPFDKMAKNHRDRSTWNWYPTKIEFWETNCVFAATRALKAGGVVPMPDYDFPGSLGDDLAGKANATPKEKNHGK